ncbi:MAG: 4-hydroxy-tetrahydrodipicolinate synthase [Methanomassiliicoccales archaeon PtaU1.Bin030]|nr:MAG: 4-hydroxy-tetrahydrodipicolinate synthase [Methanomassiliicoccales archaeon PtaU1.Bin030]
MFSGCATAIITPMTRTGDIDEEGLRETVRFQEEKGIRIIVPCGSTGESATLNHEEHLQVIKIVRDETRRSKVIAGTGSNATSEAIHLSKGAKDLGVDGVLSVSPYYNKPTQAGIIKHFEAIDAAVDIPTIIYNIPSRTGSNITATTMLRLAEIPSMVGVKEASGDINQIAKILAGAPKDFTVLSGDDAMVLPAMALGAKGVISVTSNILPEAMLSLVRAILDGDMAEARRINHDMLPIFNALFLETNPIPVKTALRLMGRPSGPFRLPLCDMSQKNLETLRSVLAERKLI